MNQTAITRMLVENLADRYIPKIQFDPHRSIRKLVDLGECLSSGATQKQFFQSVQKLLEKENNPYYALVQRVISQVDAGAIKTIGMNLSLNSWVSLASRKSRETAPPWTLMFYLENTPGALALEKEIIALSDRLLAAQADYDFINREVLLGCRCEGGRIITPCGETPAYLIFPPVDFVDTEVAQVIHQAISAGVQVIMGGERRKICGLTDLSGVRFEAEEGLVCGSDLVVENEPQLTFMHRSFGMQQVYLMVNTGEEEICKAASIPESGRNLLLLDPDSGEEKALSCEIRDGRVWFDMNIPSGSARILVQS